MNTQDDLPGVSRPTVWVRFKIFCPIDPVDSEPVERSVVGVAIESPVAAAGQVGQAGAGRPGGAELVASSRNTPGIRSESAAVSAATAGDGAGCC